MRTEGRTRGPGKPRRRSRTGLLALLLLLLPFAARAELLAVPEGVREIGPEAFAGCGTLDRVRIPDSVETIGPDAFRGCGEALLVQCGPESPAVAYAEAHQLDYQAGTVYRALMIAQVYEGTPRELEGPKQDAEAVRQCLGRLTVTPFAVTVARDLTAPGIIEAIRSTFGQATERDVSLVWYSGHGARDGSLEGTGRTFLSPTQLRKVLDTVPGRKVIIVDACYSGSLIGRGSTARRGSGGDDFITAFLGAFRSGGGAGRRAALTVSPYFVITAAHSDQESREGWIHNPREASMGFFTYAFCRGCGWEAPGIGPVRLFADANGDGAVSIREACAYAGTGAQAFNPDQQAEAWPADCGWFAPFRP